MDLGEKVSEMAYPFKGADKAADSSILGVRIGQYVNWAAPRG